MSKKLCPLCSEELYEIDIDNVTYYKCLTCCDADDHEFNEYKNSIKAFTEAIKDWI